MNTENEVQNANGQEHDSVVCENETLDIEIQHKPATDDQQSVAVLQSDENLDAPDGQKLDLDEKPVLQSVGSGNVNDPFAYLQRNDFTSEKFKIEIRGLPKFYGIKELRTLFNQKLALNCSKIKPPKNRGNLLYVCFRSDEDREKAINVLNGYQWKNKILSAKIASAIPDPLVKMRNKKKIKLDYEEIVKQYKYHIVSLWDVEHNEQLKIKADIAKDILKIFAKELTSAHKHNFKLTSWLERQITLNDGMPCIFENVMHDDTPGIINGYRNKCEFTIGKDYEEKRAIGFRIGAYTTGTVNIGPIADMPHVPSEMKTIVKMFEFFVQNSDLEVYNPEDHTGYWTQLTIRLGMATKQTMVVVGLNPQNLTENELTYLKGNIVQFFLDKKQECDVTSLHIQYIAKKNSGDKLNKFEHLEGSPTIIEQLRELKFAISPESFFQVNTQATEVLYDCVKNVASVTNETVLLDICCGTGTIGIYLSKYCKEVVGIESELKAVLNARKNCKLNNIENCKFYQGKAEDILGSVFADIGEADIVAVVDPPRAGLHQKAIIQLRKACNIKKLVYLSCNPKAAMKNFVSLGRPMSKTLDGTPFVPLKAIPVDMFPHTKHFELILYFERFSEIFLEQ